MYEFKPLYQQVDGGFGVIGDAFKEAADRLSKSSEESAFFHSDLPICYLYRHAIELFLKSGIVVIHRRLQIPYDPQGRESAPGFRVGKKWNPIESIHSVGDLYAYFKTLFVDHGKTLNTLGRVDWTSPVPELDEWIDIIERSDRKSTFFRYPTLKQPSTDKIKADFQETSPEALLAWAKSSGRYIKPYIEEAPNDQSTRIYFYEGAHLDELKGALRKAADMLSGIHFGIRMEIAGGQ